MPFKLQQIPEESKLSHALRLPLVEKYYPREVVCELLSQCHAWEERARKLAQLLIVYYITALSLFRQYNVTEVFAHLCRGWRWLWPDPFIASPRRAGAPCLPEGRAWESRGGACSFGAVVVPWRQKRPKEPSRWAGG